MGARMVNEGGRGVEKREGGLLGLVVGGEVGEELLRGGLLLLLLVLEVEIDGVVAGGHGTLDVFGREHGSWVHVLLRLQVRSGVCMWTIVVLLHSGVWFRN